MWCQTWNVNGELDASESRLGVRVRVYVHVFRFQVLVEVYRCVGTDARFTDARFTDAWAQGSAFGRGLKIRE